MAFTNESPADFSLAGPRVQFSSALEQVALKIQAKSFAAKPIIDGQEIETTQIHERKDPSDGITVVGCVHYANLSHVAEALQSLRQGAEAWDLSGAEARAAILDRLATIMHQRRNDLAALMVREAGKPWRESDADVVEAIDFCRYYADQMRTLGVPRSTAEVPGEENIYFYQPRGIAVIISPWNFPLAIACGMTVAALVAGNATVLKPAEQTSIIASVFAKMILEAGVPGNAFAFLPGLGEEIGRALVDSPQVDCICFTGSKAVGLEIISSAATVREGQRSIKKVIAELGGKNAILIDEDADLDEAVKGVLYSAFGFAGQKCSACSRLIAVGAAYEPLLARLKEAAADALVGPALVAATLVGPVIDKESYERILATIARAQKESTLLFKGTAPRNGYFVPITIFRDVLFTSALWREEIFGPVIACASVNSLDQAIEVANDSPYALTGGLYSRSPHNIARAKRDFRVGNLYINRGCTGAIVCRQPFGGFRMSGVGSKAGGPDYLLQFLEPRTVTENTMRRGFSPDSGA